MPDDPPANPTPSLAGPSDGDSISQQELNGRGFIDVDFTVPTGQRLNDASIADAAPEFTVTVSGGGTVTVDTTQAPILIDATNHTYRYWVQVRGDVTGAITLTPIDKSWVATDTATGEDVPNAGTLTPHGHFSTGYIDVLLAPTASQTVDTTTLGSNDFTSLVDGVRQNGRVPRHARADADSGHEHLPLLPRGRLRARPGDRDVPGRLVERHRPPEHRRCRHVHCRRAAGDGRRPVQREYGPSIDVGVVNAQTDGTTGPRYIDVTYTATPGSTLDYASIFDTDPEFTLTETLANGTVTPIAVGQPTAIRMVADPNTGALVAQAAGSSDPATLTQLGVTRFRYDFTSTTTAFAPGHVSVAFIAGSWADSQSRQPLARADRSRSTSSARPPTSSCRSPVAASTSTR